MILIGVGWGQPGRYPLAGDERDELGLEPAAPARISRVGPVQGFGSGAQRGQQVVAPPGAIGHQVQLTRVR